MQSIRTRPTEIFPVTSFDPKEAFESLLKSQLNATTYFSTLVRGSLHAWYQQNASLFNQTNACQILGTIVHFGSGDEKAKIIEVAKMALLHKHALVRNTMIRYLANLMKVATPTQRGSMLSTIELALSNSNLLIRENACQALEIMLSGATDKEKEKITLLLNHAKKDPSETVATAALQAMNLSLFSKKENVKSELTISKPTTLSFDTALKALEDNSNVVKMSTLQNIHTLTIDTVEKRNTLTSSLINLLSDKEVHIRKAACQAIKNIIAKQENREETHQVLKDITTKVGIAIFNNFEIVNLLSSLHEKMNIAKIQEQQKRVAVTA